MSSFFGQHIQLALFGQSHGQAIGITIDGLPPGIKLDRDFIARQMARRAPGKDAYSTTRREKDEVEILSGVMDDRLTGQPLCAIIRNHDQRSQDYGDRLDLLRPGHADYTGHVRYHGFEDFRGGGHFSGRLTAPIVFAGALMQQCLADKGVQISGRVKAINGNETEGMLDEIAKAQATGDSVGGEIVLNAKGVAKGLGAPFFDSVESVLSHLFFAIPGIKGVVFGEGIECSRMLGSAFNDTYTIQNGDIAMKTNHSGGVLGGITNGADIVARLFVRPTPSIAKVQQTISLQSKTEQLLQTHGRHDPCIVLRALPVAEAMMAIGLMELWKERQAWQG